MPDILSRLVLRDYQTEPDESILDSLIINVYPAVLVEMSKEFRFKLIKNYEN